MKKQLIYSAPVVEVIEVAIENGIAQSGGGVTPGAPGAPGDVIYDSGEDNYDF